VLYVFLKLCLAIAIVFVIFSPDSSGNPF